MVQVLDQAQDISGRELHRLTNIFGPPDFVKAATQERLFGNVDAQPRHTYADQRNKLYPLHTAPATWVSTLFFLDKQAQYKPAEAQQVDTRLREAAAHWGIVGDTEMLRTKFAQQSGDILAELDDDDFAVVWESNGVKERHYPLRNAAEIKTAARYFVQHRDEFTFPDRHRIAIKVLDKAGQAGADITDESDVLEKSAGWGTCAAELAAKAIDLRGGLLMRTQPSVGHELRKLAKQLMANPSQTRSPEALYKLACTVDMIDQNTELRHHYADGTLERPEEVFYPITMKVAAAFASQHVVTTTGAVYEQADFQKLSFGDVEEWLGREFASAVSDGGLLLNPMKMANIVPTLDRGEARVFDRMMQAANISPVFEEKAASTGALAGDNLLKQALAFKK